MGRQQTIDRATIDREAGAVSPELRTEAFDFELPGDAIADRPVSPRDSARLLEVGESLRDGTVRELAERLLPGDVLVLNDTRVIPSRLVGRRRAARIEVTLHKRIASLTWRALARPARRLHVGDVIEFAPDFIAEVTEKLEHGEVGLRFAEGCDVVAALARHGVMPLPPYIARAAGPDTRDRADYQTVYAARDGAVAAPTAGLHFTDALLRRIESQGTRLVRVTLHVGAGTFLPVKAEFVRDHRMHAEWGEVSREAAAAVNRARQGGGRVVAVGTTSLRLLESAADEDGQLAPFAGETSIFITPGYRFRVVDMLLTNFHLPRSTLFMLVAAFAGLERMRAAYDYARAHDFRFYSYGDATLLHRQEPP